MEESPLYFASDSGSNNEEDEYSKPSQSDEMEWNAIVAAFRMYKAAYGDLNVPSRFIVPSMPPWPENSWGLKLGHRVAAIRATGKYVLGQPTRQRFLERLGFQWQLRSAKKSATRRSTAVGSSASVSGKVNPNEETYPLEDGITLDQVYAALETYQTEVADVSPATTPLRSIPHNFIVPNRPPWVESTRGLPLGKIVPKLLRAKAWLQANPQVKSRLESLLANPDGGTAGSLGLSSDDRPLGRLATNDARFQKVYEALKRYAELYGDLLVPQPFVVPDSSQEWPEELWGLRLGARVNAIRSQGTFVSNNPQRKKLLDQLGFVWSPPASSSSSSSSNSNGSSSSGTVPGAKKRGRRPKSEDTSSITAAAAGAKLTDGTAAAGISASLEDRNAEDNDGGGEDDQGTTKDDSFLSFDNWLDPSLDFGGSAASRNDDDDKLFQFQYQQNQLQQTPPTWGLEDPQSLQQQQLQQQPPPRLATDFSRSSSSSSLTDDTEVDNDEIKIPKSLAETLEEATARAVEVGVIEPMTDDKRIKKGKRDKDIPWFNDDFGDEFVFEDVVEGLAIYKTMYGDFANLTTNYDFVIPLGGGTSGDEYDEYEDDFFGDVSTNVESFDVGASARAAAAIAAYQKRNQMSQSQELIASEIRRIQSEMSSSDSPMESNVAVQMRTTATTTQWPEYLGGMALGGIVKRIQDGSLEVKHLPERKAQLDALDFDWGDPKQFIDVPFEKAMCAMYAYYLVRGDMFVYEDFNIPDEDPWPKVLAGYEIGKAVKRLRELQHTLEAYHPEKVSLLRMIDFMWFPTLALPLDPNEPEMTPETLLLSAMGHPDYSKMIDIPMGLPDKIVADGPFFETNDPKLWWRQWHNWEYVKDYWYQQGRRDNAFVLRVMGYPQMAAEHEAKYGPGLFQLMEETLQQIEEGTVGETQEERDELLQKLNYYRSEMVGCTDIHPQDRAKVLDDLDAQINSLITQGRGDVNKLSRFRTDVYLYETTANGQEQQISNDDEENGPISLAANDDEEDMVEEEEDDDEDEEEEYDDSDDIDVEDELGLFQ